MSSTKKYNTVHICWTCDGIYSDEDNAYECCEGDVATMYECIQCAELHDSSSEAEECCCYDLIRCGNCARGYKPGDINEYVLDVVGKCNRCTPLISVEDRCEIESRIRDADIGDIHRAELEEEIHKL